MECAHASDSAIITGFADYAPGVDLSLPSSVRVRPGGFAPKTSIVGSASRRDVGSPVHVYSIIMNRHMERPLRWTALLVGILVVLAPVAAEAALQLYAKYVSKRVRLLRSDAQTGMEQCA
jgi:hypothetical protein